MKPVVWLGDSLARLRAASADVRSDAGYQLDLVQHGETPTDFRPMPDVGSGVVEVRVHGENEFRVFYVVDSRRLSMCCTASSRKHVATRKADIELGKRRYAAILELRRPK
jgi:phage-related protein